MITRESLMFSFFRRRKAQPVSQSRRSFERRGLFENLESRCVLSGSGLGQEIGELFAESESTAPPYATGVVFLDVNGDGTVAPIDALSIINELNANGSGIFDPFRPGVVVGWWDTSGDGWVAPNDALIVINDLNLNGAHQVFFPPTGVLPLVHYDMTLNVQEQQTIFFAAPFFDPLGKTLSIAVGDNPADGNLLRQPDGTTFSYQATGVASTDIFTLKAVSSDGRLAVATITVNVTTSPGPHAPIAREDVVKAREDTPITFSVITNDVDVDGDSFSVTGNTQPLHGQLTELGGGNFQYIPGVNFVGADSFQYTLRDATGLESTGVVFLDVSTNRPPVPRNPTVIVFEDSQSVALGVGDLGTDPDGDAVTFTVENAVNGSIQIIGGEVQYTPNPNFVGTDTAVYILSDGFDSSEGVITYLVSEERFVGPSVTRAEAVFVIAELTAGNASPATPVYADLTETHWAFSFVQETAQQGFLNDGFANGSNFFPDRFVTIGEVANLFVQAFNLQGPDFVTAAVNACVITQAQAQRLADTATDAEFWTGLARAERECGPSDADIDLLAHDRARQFGTTF